MRNDEIYRERRRTVSAFLIAAIATLLDALSSKGSGWPVIQSFGFFLVLANGPLVLVKVADTLFGKDADA